MRLQSPPAPPAPYFCSLVPILLILHVTRALRFHFEGGSDADEWQRPCVYLTHEQLLDCVRQHGFDILVVQPSLTPGLYT